MNWGGFAGGFAQGLNQTFDAKGFGRYLMSPERRMEEIAAKGMAEANAARDAEIAGMVQETGITGKPASQVTGTPPTEATPPVAQTATPQEAPVATATPPQEAAVTPGSGAKAIAESAPTPIAPTPNTPAATQTPSGDGKMTHDGLPARKNADGSYSTEVSITVTNPKLNGGKPTNIPSLWGGKEVDEDTAVANALSSGKTYQAFESVDQAVGAAQARSNAGGAGAPQAAQGLPFTVGNKSYATREEAQAAATKQAPSVMDFMYKSAFPKMQEAYIAKGDMEGADRLQKYIESKRGKDAVESFGKAMNKLMFTNDVNGAVQELGNYYTKHVDDGVDFTKGEVTPDGKIAITTKNKADGKESTISMSRGQLLRMGMAYNPAKLLEMSLTQADEAEKASAKTAGEIAKENRVFNRDIEKMSIEKQLDAANSSTKFRREVNAKVDALRTAGYSDEFINGAMPGIIGVGDYKKMTSPEEARRLAHSDRMKNDPVYARKSGAEQSKMLDQDMTTIYAGMKPTKTPGAEAPATPSAASGGLPKAGGKGIPVFDTKTGQIVYK